MAEGTGYPLLQALAADLLRAQGLYNETLAFLRIASDHMKFIRNYTDPTQEALFRQADALAVTLDGLRAELSCLAEPVAPAVVFAFVERTVPVLRQVTAFKRGLAHLIRGCRVQHLWPAELIDHLRREVDFYLAIVDHVLGSPGTETGGELVGAGAPGTPVGLIARALIDKGSLPEAVAANLAWTQFWGRHHQEHADALTQFLRPQDEELIRGARWFRGQFAALLAAGAGVAAVPTAPGLAHFQRDTLLLNQDWQRFLQQALIAQRTCAAQENFPQRLTEHMLIETDLLHEAVLRSRARVAGTVLTGVPAVGATYDQLTPRVVLLA